VFKSLQYLFFIIAEVISFLSANAIIYFSFSSYSTPPPPPNKQNKTKQRTAIFGIPIGILGAGFEEVVEEETEDDDRETTTTVATSATKTQQREVSWTASTRGGGTDAERWCYNLVNGYGSALSQAIETLVYILIFVAISIGVLQTVKGHENDFSGVEAFTVYAFTLEYIIRFIGVGADPSFSSSSGTTTPGSIMNGFVSRIKYVFSFYSIIDLLAILPYYIALLLPEGLVDQYDEYLRMARIFRLLKLDKYAPSFTLIDDVIRYKWDSLKVAGYAAITLWTVFAGLIYLFEYTDSTNGIDPVPLYGCVDDCMMMDRFRNFFDSFFYTGKCVHYVFFLYGFRLCPPTLYRVLGTAIDIIINTSYVSLFHFSPFSRL
ncbi:MAG: hypothetical protein ACI8RD_007940, partial [Bacillariaceae sp.]|jgi:hypothetical protein